jgi:hypothetical protein
MITVQTVCGCAAAFDEEHAYLQNLIQSSHGMKYSRREFELFRNELLLAWDCLRISSRRYLHTLLVFRNQELARLQPFSHAARAIARLEDGYTNTVRTVRADLRHARMDMDAIIESVYTA